MTSHCTLMETYDLHCTLMEPYDLPLHFDGNLWPPTVLWWKLMTSTALWWKCRHFLPGPGTRWSLTTTGPATCLSLLFTFHQRSGYFSPQDPPGSGLLESSVAFSFFHQVCPAPTSVSLRIFTPMPTSPQRRLPSALRYSSALDHPISSPRSICGELLMRLPLYGHILHIGPPRRL